MIYKDDVTVVKSIERRDYQIVKSVIPSRFLFLAEVCAESDLPSLVRANHKG
jgi:hypothetical protein